MAMEITRQPWEQDSLTNVDGLHSLYSAVVVETDVHGVREQLQDFCFAKWLIVRLDVHGVADLQACQKTC